MAGLMADLPPLSSVIDPDLRNLIISTRNLAPRMRKIFNFKEKLERERRRDIRKLKDLIGSEDMLVLAAYVKNLKLYYLPDVECKKSIARVYLVALKTFDHHAPRIKDYLSRMPYDDFSKPTEEVVQFYEEIRNDIETQILRTIRLQELQLTLFIETLSLNHYWTFLKLYRQELVLQEELIKKAKVKIKLYAEFRKSLSRKITAYGEFRDQHKKAFVLFGFSALTLCCFAGTFALPSVFFGFFRSFDFLSSAQGFMDCLSDTNLA